MVSGLYMNNNPEFIYHLLLVALMPTLIVMLLLFNCNISSNHQSKRRITRFNSPTKKSRERLKFLNAIFCAETSLNWAIEFAYFRNSCRFYEIVICISDKISFFFVVLNQRKKLHLHILILRLKKVEKVEKVEKNG